MPEHAAHKHHKRTAHRAIQCQTLAWCTMAAAAAQATTSYRATACCKCKLPLHCDICLTPLIRACYGQQPNLSMCTAAVADALHYECHTAINSMSHRLVKVSQMLRQTPDCTSAAEPQGHFHSSPNKPPFATWDSASHATTSPHTLSHFPPAHLTHPRHPNGP